MSLVNNLKSMSTIFTSAQNFTKYLLRHYRQRRQHDLSRSIRCAALAREYWIRHAAKINRTRDSAVAMDLTSMFDWSFVLVYSLLFGTLPEILHAFQTFTNASGTSSLHWYISIGVLTTHRRPDTPLPATKEVFFGSRSGLSLVESPSQFQTVAY